MDLKTLNDIHDYMKDGHIVYVGLIGSGIDESIKLGKILELTAKCTNEAVQILLPEEKDIIDKFVDKSFPDIQVTILPKDIPEDTIQNIILGDMCPKVHKVKSFIADLSEKIVRYYDPEDNTREFLEKKSGGRGKKKNGSKNRQRRRRL